MNTPPSRHPEPPRTGQPPLPPDGTAACPPDDRLLRHLDAETHAIRTGGFQQPPIDEHLARCPRCIARMAAFRRASLRLRSSYSEPLPTDILARIRSGPPLWRARRRHQRVAGSLAVAALLALSALPAWHYLLPTSATSVIDPLQNPPYPLAAIDTAASAYFDSAEARSFETPEAVLASWITRDLQYHLDP